MRVNCSDIKPAVRVQLYNTHCQPVSSEMFGSHATLVVVMASAIFGLRLGEKLSKISLSDYKDVKFENCKNSNASSKVELVKLYPCKHTPCFPRLDGTLYLLLIEFIPAEEVRHMHLRIEVGGKRLPWVYPSSKKWVEMPWGRKQSGDVSPDICGSHNTAITNSSCPLKAGAPISMIWPLREKLKASLHHTLTNGMVQFRMNFLHHNGKPILCYKIPIHL